MKTSVVRLRLASLAFSLLALTLLSACLPTQAAVPHAFGTLLSYDFDAKSWPGAKTAAVGTADVAGSKQPSRGLRGAQVQSGPIAVRSSETNLGKLTLAFSLSASSTKPVTVRVTSYNAAKERTGSLQTLVYPAAPEFYQRYAVDLSTCKPSGAGKFVPNAPFVGFTFSSMSCSEVRVDNVNYALPAFYVSPQGSDKNDGRTEKTAFATPQKGLDSTQPGNWCSWTARIWGAQARRRRHSDWALRRRSCAPARLPRGLC